jgi:viroplasmin and RNaseH domain-containing protein
MARSKKLYYAVHAPYTEAAIYKTWNYAQQFCNPGGGRSKPVFKGFVTYNEALYFYHTGRESHTLGTSAIPRTVVSANE